MKTLTEDWLAAAKDDLAVIEKIIDEDHLSHMVAFHSQQCIEKVFKAILEECSIEIPKIHKLMTLYGTVEGFIKDIDMTLLKTLDELYIDARYPSDLGLLPHGKPSKTDAQKFYEFGKTVYVQSKRYISGEDR